MRNARRCAPQRMIHRGDSGFCPAGLRNCQDSRKPHVRQQASRHHRLHAIRAEAGGTSPKSRGTPGTTLEPPSRLPPRITARGTHSLHFSTDGKIADATGVIMWRFCSGVQISQAPFNRRDPECQLARCHRIEPPAICYHVAAQDLEQGGYAYRRPRMAQLPPHRPKRSRWRPAHDL